MSYQLANNFGFIQLNSAGNITLSGTGYNVTSPSIQFNGNVLIPIGNLNVHNLLNLGTTDNITFDGTDLKTSLASKSDVVKIDYRM